MKYDLAFALGSSCTATDVLRQAGLQFTAFPLDWIGRLSVRTCAELIFGGFEDFLSLSRIRIEDDLDDGRFRHCVDDGLGTAFSHDFPVGKSVEEAYPAVKEKYDRRIARFLSLLKQSKSVLVVWIGDFRDGRDGVSSTDEDFRHAAERLSMRYPRTKFDFMVFELPPAGGDARPADVSRDGFRRITLSYRDVAEGPESWKIQTDRFRPYFRGISVRDYRDAAAKRAQRLRERESRFARFGVDNAFSYALARLQYQICRKIGRSLRRRGVRL